MKEVIKKMRRRKFENKIKNERGTKRKRDDSDVEEGKASLNKQRTNKEQMKEKKSE